MKQYRLSDGTLVPAVGFGTYRAGETAAPFLWRWRPDTAISTPPLITLMKNWWERP